MVTLQNHIQGRTMLCIFSCMICTPVMVHTTCCHDKLLAEDAVILEIANEILSASKCLKMAAIAVVHELDDRQAMLHVIFNFHL